MNQVYSLLMVNINADDADRMLRELQQADLRCSVTRVSKRTEYLCHLAMRPPSVILSGLAGESLDGLSALAIARKLCPAVPFIIVSETPGEEFAVEAMKNGAVDYILKGRIERLGRSVKRALESAPQTTHVPDELTGNRQALKPGRDEVCDGAVRLQVGGIVHDYNNTLGIIASHVAHIQKQACLSETVGKHLAAIDAATLRGTALTRSLIAWLKGDQVQPEPVALNEIIREVARSMEPTFPAGMSVDFDLDPDLPWVTGDTTQMYQALLNICTNARDAMPEGGTLSISTRVSAEEGFPTAFSPSAAEAAYVCVRISDTGVGMSEDVQQRMFDPFFTTKGNGSGTGLGLAVVRRVMHSHRGHMEVSSASGQGTIVRLFLPLDNCADKTSRVH